MSVIYIKEQGSCLRRKGEQIAVTKGSQSLLEFPNHHVDQIVALGNVQVTSQALAKLLEHGVDISYFSFGGKYIGHTVSENSKNIFLRFAQYLLWCGFHLFMQSAVSAYFWGFSAFRLFIFAHKKA